MQMPRSPSSSGSFCDIAWQARRRTLKVPIRFTLITLWKISRSCGPCFEAVRCAQPMPAQQTEMRRPPSASAAASTAACTGSGSITFTSMNRPSSSEASASPFSTLRSAITTLAPRSCSARAVAAPRPEAPPATSALAPSILMRRGRVTKSPQPETWSR
jgi:hypothetical protein